MFRAFSLAAGVTPILMALGGLFLGALTALAVAAAIRARPGRVMPQAARAR